MGSNTRSISHSNTDSSTLTFALLGAEAAALLGAGGGALVQGHGLGEALAAGDLAVHVIGQIPQQTHAVLHQLQERRGERRGYHGP